jgi:predicted rRNA methylase YqxC with S4 and FtsJ domains
MRKAMRRTPPAYFDLIQWLRDRNYANTRKQAKDMILAGKVKADSHTLGVGQEPFIDANGQIAYRPAVMQHVPAELKPRVVVSK